MADIHSALKQLRTAVSSLTDEIKGLDADIERLHNERSIISSAPVSKEEYLGFVRKDMARRGHHARMYIAHNIEGQNKGYSFLARSIHHGGLSIPYLLGHKEGWPLEVSEDAIFALLGEKIVDAVGVVIGEMEWPEAGLPIAEREQRLTSLDEQIAALTKRRDELAKQLINAGLAG